MLYELDLKPDAAGEIKTVTLDTSLSLYFLKKMQQENLLSKNFIANLVMTEADPTKANYDDLLNSPYIAYRNANPNGMKKEEFEASVLFDMDMCSVVYADIIQGEQKRSGAMANSFRRVTQRKK
ncbi:hypothetical protein [Proteiniclasticum sp.]|uniref:hypothetical protein n=1 Tax=Proteiniclasticum sp. TaxID=2053595 RepID=UPI00289EF685|nr:hypothetical protein [Proteiniclasticum sp.]